MRISLAVVLSIACACSSSSPRGATTDGDEDLQPTQSGDSVSGDTSGDSTVAGDSTSSGDGGDTSTSGDGDVVPGDEVPPPSLGAPCSTIAERACDATIYMECSTEGVWTQLETCADACAPDLGCVFCVPGSTQCVDAQHMQICLPDGSGFGAPSFCDPVQGLSCSELTGACFGPCAFLSAAYVGCDYYPTLTANLVDPEFFFAVSVSNTGGSAANVQIEGGALVGPLEHVVEPGAVWVTELPWVDELNVWGSHSTWLVDGAYRLRSDQPVTAYQFHPLEYFIPPNDRAASNDASLLIPTPTLTENYVVVTRQASAVYPSLMAVTATQDDTHVTITPTAAVEAGDVGPFAAGEPRTVTLGQQDVLQLLAYDGDFTGTLVAATKPVQVIGGHFCSNVPEDKHACDHLEEIIFPTETLGNEYVVTAPAHPTTLTANPHVVRVVAIVDDTELTYEPSIAGAPTTLASAGDYVELPLGAHDFALLSNHPVLVAQFMTGQAVTGGAGDPAMVQAVPVQQFRGLYLFHAPTNYEVNFVNIVAPEDANVEIDGVPLAGFFSLGESGYKALRHKLGEGDAGNHTITANMPVGISVYGYGQYTSYWYPGGMNLTQF